MAASARGFSPVTPQVVGVQAGKDRFSRHPPPKFARWRNNLTALSQVQNLYFVAYLDKLHVYQPRFPAQAVTAEPALILSLPRSKPGLTGYIDPRHPHAVNTLLLDDLGKEEIVVCACDDGDVVAYHTRAISDAIRRMADGDVSPIADCGAVKAFFNENVGKSAWGVAIHSAARMLAVSSNTHLITVFTFALSQPEPDPRSDAFGEDCVPHRGTREIHDWAAISPHPDIRRSRTRNVRITLSGHRENIPNIAFYNSRRYSDHQYLASTDISGALVIWDVWERRAERRIAFNAEIRSALVHNQPQPPHWAVSERGWGVSCLDLSAFKVASCVPEVFGCEGYPQRNKTEHGNPWDITCSVRQVADSSSEHPAFATHNDAATLPVSVDQVDVPMLEDFLEGESVDGDDSEDEMNGTLGDQFLAEYELAAGTIDEDETGEQTDTVNATSTMVGTQTLWESYHNDSPEVMAAHSPGTPPSIASAVTVATEPELNMASTTKTEESPKPFSGLFENFAILHSSDKHIRILDTCSFEPVVLCRRPLEQAIPFSVSIHLRQFERMNMLVPIPELGIVVVASQQGRAAILSLTRPRKTSLTTFRIDAIIPYASQEQEGHRPKMPLLGIAAGPIQGREKISDPDNVHGLASRRNRRQTWQKVERQRRYRLMMTYYDGSVLSYEIGREVSGDLAATSLVF
ncbi:MAG: hypothetical protein M1817_004585 [Caeruleum heppii]|nr:MAG: hypothetical protein M1817_004585 [Caeruleum heppii]